MNTWLLLADPKSYSFADLRRDKTTVWDGISGSLAQKHLRNFKRGDRLLIYHTAPDKAAGRCVRETCCSQGWRSHPPADPGAARSLEKQSRAVGHGIP
jgi:predicted RNA-binding protein with PUA-like domain